jgi:diphthine-ammonia ligase
MCGIIGIFNNKDHERLIKSGLNKIKYRGIDGLNYHNEKSFSLGHALHSIVNNINQPLTKDKFFFVTNCEIYNWTELNKKYELNAKNDAELLFKLLIKKGCNNKTLNELDGVYAFSFIDKDKLYLARDIIGVKPLFYSNTDGFYFASEKKALNEIKCNEIIELDPRKILAYELEKNKIKFEERNFFNITPQLKHTEKKISGKVSELFEKALIKRIPNVKFGLLFSGGIDSTLIAYLLKKKGYDFICYTTAIKDELMNEPLDLVASKKIAKELDLNLKIIELDSNKIDEQIKELIPIIETNDTVKIEVGLTFFSACKSAKKDGCKVIFSGLGSEEIFAGYNRHKQSKDINNECVKGLLQLHDRDLYRDDVISMYNNLELRLPYLDKDLIKYALKIPTKYKIKDDVLKYILRVSAINMGLNIDFSMRKKKAAQYGSNISKAVSKLSRQKGFKYKKDYLEYLSNNK